MEAYIKDQGRYREKRRRRLKLRVDRSRARSSRSFDALFSDREFYTLFRMSRSTFERLVDLLRPEMGERLDPANMEGRKASGCAIVELRGRVGISLRVLAGAAYQDVAAAFHVSCTTVYEAFHQFIDGGT